MITGACGCGAVRFEVGEPFLAASYCHCTRCQRRTGTGSSANAVAAPGSFRLVAGEEHVGAWVPPDGAEKHFCRLCGSHLFSRLGKRIGVRLGAVDGDPGISPQWHQFVAYAAPWEPLPDDGLPRFDERRPA